MICATIPQAAPLMRFGASVEFDKVSFQHPGGRRVFENLNLRIEAGQRVGLVGPSGGGKSTLFALLQRFYDVQQRAHPDRRAGHRARDAGKPAGRDRGRAAGRLAVPPVDHGEHPLRAAGAPPTRRCSAAAAAARCDFIEALPKGMATIVGDRGVKLSGGQRQRIAIARAFLKDAPLLLLDEATSALDSESEEVIRQALGHLMRDRTVIAIAHRLSTVRAFDRIVVLHAGRIRAGRLAGSVDEARGIVPRLAPAANRVREKSRIAAVQNGTVVAQQLMRRMLEHRVWPHRVGIHGFRLRIGRCVTDGRRDSLLD